MLKHLFSFSGRSGRLEYLFHSIADIFGILTVIMVISIIERRLNVPVREEVVVFTVLGIIVVGAVAELAATVRRFHDLGMSGWYLLGTLVPFYNIYLSLILLFQRGEDLPNTYGPNLK